MNVHVVTGLIQAGSAGAAVTRGVHLNLAKEYRALFAFLVFMAVNEFVLAVINPVSSLYFWLYICFGATRCVLAVLAVRELVSLTLVDYPGIRTLARWVVYGATVVALSVSLMITRMIWTDTAAGRAHSHLFYIELLKRSVIVSLAAIIVVFLLFISRYPLELSRNTVFTSLFFSAIFLSEGIRLLLDSVTPLLYNGSVDYGQSLIVSACLIGWTLRLHQPVEPVRAKIRFTNPHEEHLLEQLNALNQLMTRSARQ